MTDTLPVLGEKHIVQMNEAVQRFEKTVVMTGESFDTPESLILRDIESVVRALSEGRVRVVPVDD